MLTITFGSSSTRDNKGKSLLCELSDYVVLDLETTGLDPAFDSIIELAALRVENNKITQSFQSLIQPGFEIQPFITELTGITNEMLSSAPDLEQVLPDFLDFIGNSIVVGHNVNFDINFIYDSCSFLLDTNFQNDFVDTLRLSRRLFKEEKHHRLSDLITRFNIGSTVEHRSLSDCTMTFYCYEYMKAYIKENNIEYSSLYPSKKKYKAINISTSKTEFDESHPVYNKYFVFTGVLGKMIRTEAMQCVLDLGGQCSDNVTRKTNYLVLGSNEYCSSIKDGKTTKQKKAEKLMLDGYDIEIISENTFYDLIESED